MIKYDDPDPEMERNVRGKLMQRKTHVLVIVRTQR